MAGTDGVLNSIDLNFYGFFFSRAQESNQKTKSFFHCFFAIDGLVAVPKRIL